MKEKSSVQSVDRIFDIIEILSEAGDGMTLTDLAAKTQLHISTAHRLVNCLVSRQYVRKDSFTNRYVLTPRLFEIGSRTINSNSLLPIALSHVQDLTKITGETVHLVVRIGSEIVYLYKEDANNSLMRTASFVGMHNPMYCTGVGKAILAFLPVTEVQKIWDNSTVTPFTPNTIIEFDTLLSDLEAIRARGYAVDNEEHEPGVSCVAVPIFNFTGMPVAAMSITYPTERVTPERQHQFGRLIIERAQYISTALGGSIPTK